VDKTGSGVVCELGCVRGLERDEWNVRCTEAVELCTWNSLGRFSLSSASLGIIPTQFVSEEYLD